MIMTLQKKIFLVALTLFTYITLGGCQQKQDNVFQGYVENELIYLSSPHSGQLFTLFVSRGEHVKKGTVIFTLDPEPETSQLIAATKQLSQAEANLKDINKGQRETVLTAIQAQISQVKADLDLANLRVSRFKKLYSANAIDKDTVDASIANAASKAAQLEQLEANLAEAKLGSREDLIQAQQATVDAAKASVAQAEWALSQKSLTSPDAGIIFDTFFLPGEWVGSGQPVAALLTAAQTRFIFFVPETMLPQIYLGEVVSVTCDSCHKSFPAVIHYISPVAEYTPPVIYSRESNYKLVYQVKAEPSLTDALFFKPGQPVYITLPNNKETQ